MKNRVLIASLILIGVSAGCVKRQQVRYDQPELPSAGYWEIAWVDPEMIISESWFTLIRAGRVDSFYVDRPEKMFELAEPSLKFDVAEDSCFTVINLVTERADIIRPILARNLGRGLYKATIDLSRLGLPAAPAGGYYLKADFCGSTATERVVFQ